MLERRELGTKYRVNKRYEHVEHVPYDYQEQGLLNKLLPKDIVKTKNIYTKSVLDAMEYVLVWLMKYVDILKNFKNPHFIKY